MITKTEIEAKAEELDVYPANVERDYVFGWVLCGIYTISPLKDVFILKGGNAFRKAYFPNTRYSNDLDFSVENEIDPALLHRELNAVCDFVQGAAGIVFDKDRNKVEEKAVIDGERKIYEAKLYFKDFYGNPDTITISIKLDITQFDKLYLPAQVRNLIHPYSDAAECVAPVRCVKLEELLAIKLKCLLQRRHWFDLYDYVHAIFINRELAVSRTEIISTFLKKTIFERNPGVARSLLLGLPFEVFKAVWNKYIVCPRQSLIDFEIALQRFTESIQELFGPFPTAAWAGAYFPAPMRNQILDAGTGLRLMAVTYDGIRRIVEPYSLVYKTRKDGHAEEYFYVYDRTGGRRSGPGIKCLINRRIQAMEVLNEAFEPRFPVELSKAGEPVQKGYFARPFRAGVTTRTAAFPRRKKRSGLVYVIECSYCGKQFRRSTYDTHLKKHTDKYKNRCYGRVGVLVDRIYTSGW